MFYDVIQPAKNRFNAAFFCGSSAIFRRSALDAIGGFATETATEGIHTSLQLHAAGWRSLFLSEVLAYGTASEDFKEYHDQRVR
jgi:cellulose synthase (UDP-forming)